MIKPTKQRFKTFPESNKSMVYLMWIYNFSQYIVGMFIGIYIFKINNDIGYVIKYYIVLMTASYLGFSGIGYIVSYLGKSIKNMYYLSYILMIFSFTILFLFKNNIYGAYLFGSIYGLGFGCFWGAVHGNELSNIKDKDRDFYSSMISAGGNIIEIISPILVTMIFIISKHININGYYILFALIPIINLISFIFIKNTGDYIPKKTRKKDIKNFYNHKKYLWGQAYMLSTGAIYVIGAVIMPIIAISILKNEVNIGIFQAIIGIVSFIIILNLSHKRNDGNRQKIFLVSSLSILIIYILFALNINIYGYIAFSLLLIILGPIFRVSEHVYDLKIMDSIKCNDTDFYPSMLLRELTLYISRMIILGVTLIIYSLFKDDLNMLLSILISINGLLYFTSYISIKLHTKYENHYDLENFH